MNTSNSFLDNIQRREEPYKRATSIIAIGDLIVDIIAEINNESIKKYNLSFGQTVLADENNITIFKELEQNPKVSYTPGGSIENTLRVLSRCLNMDENNKNNYKITMLGSAGNDKNAKKIMNALKTNGITPLVQIIPNMETSRCAVGIYKKERCIVTEIKASSQLSESFVLQNLNEIFNHDILLIEGYFVKNKPDICNYLCDEFNRENKIVLLTLSAVFLMQYYYEKIFEIANKADIIVSNIEELETFAGGKEKTIIDTLTKVHKKLSKKDRIIVTTNGPKEVICSKYDYENDQMDFVINCFPKHITNDEICDLNGAGDAFLGGFLSQYIQGNPLSSCCKAGNSAANVIIRNVGCTFPKKANFDFK